jgi:hypothetical protein
MLAGVFPDAIDRFRSPAVARPLDLIPAYTAFAGLAGLLATAVVLTDFSARTSLFVGLMQLMAMLVSGRMLRWVGLPRLGGGIEAVALLTGFSICAALMSLVLAATALPFVDPMLAQADSLLFGDDIWRDLLSIARATPVQWPGCP